MKKIFLLSVLFFIFFSSPVFAQSDYIFPYPSLMPGSKLYILQEIRSNLMKYWYFGNFGQYMYHLNQADKYLVEAKTLFEYKQYLLADNALRKSDYFFIKAPIYLENAKKENKDISQKNKLLKEASLKHIEVLNNIKINVPESFMWKPERSRATFLNIKKNIEQSIKIRTKAL